MKYRVFVIIEEESDDGDIYAEVSSDCVAAADTIEEAEEMRDNILDTYL